VAVAGDALTVALRRVRQAWWYLWAPLRDEDVRWASSLLDVRLGALFAGMARPDRSHALRVARRVQAAGGDRDLVRAALLHDVGKPAGYGLFWRTVCVLLPPAPVEQPAGPVGTLAWARHVYAHHEQSGRDMLVAAGADEVLLDRVSGRGPERDSQMLGAADDLG